MDITSNLLLRSNGGGTTGPSAAMAAMADVTRAFNDERFSQRQVSEVAGIEFLTLKDALLGCTKSTTGKEEVWGPHAEWMLLPPRDATTAAAYAALPTFRQFFAPRSFRNSNHEHHEQRPSRRQRSQRCPTDILMSLIDSMIPDDIDGRPVLWDEVIAHASEMLEGSCHRVRVRELPDADAAADLRWLAHEIGLDADVLEIMESDPDAFAEALVRDAIRFVQKTSALRALREKK
jgi:hypothetical protein